MMRHTLSPDQRLKRKKDFDRLRQVGQKLYCKNFLVVLADSETGRSRIGLTVSKKVDKRAVKRNYVKRRVREVFRLHQAQLSKPFDIIVIARQNAQLCDYSEIKRQLIGCLKYHGLLEQ
ncbi:MAG: ribonuclease P protein component [Bdellovibrionales bacterium]|nr:ribonuclease P protein component [Bdellovibrionales bacterium]